MQVERGGERAEDELVRAQRAGERVRPRARDEVLLADQDSRLRAAEDLVAREADEVRARVEGLERYGLVRERRLGEARGSARPGVEDHGRAAPVRERRDRKSTRLNSSHLGISSAV